MDYGLFDRNRYLPDLNTARTAGLADFYSIIDMIGPQKGQRILEIGCGCGALLLALREKGYSECSGVDPNPDLVAHATTALGVDVATDDWASCLNRSEQKYDVIVALDVLEHIDSTEAPRILELARSRIADGGRLILRVPNALCPFALPILYGDPTHRFLAVPSTMKYWLGSAGFSNVRICETRPSGGIKRIVFSLFHGAVVKPLIGLAYYHFHGEFPSHITPNIICCGYVVRS
jgi:SAM-dependent methyltransferase